MKKVTRIPSDIFPTGVYELHIGFRRVLPFRLPVKRSEDLHKFIKETLYLEGEVEYSEKFFVLMLDRTNKVYCYKLLSTGGLTGTVVDIRLLFQAVILSHATGIILVHNHPSGNTQPSEADLTLTKRIVDAGKIFEIGILDHIIIGGNEYYSFADEGML